MTAITEGSMVRYRGDLPHEDHPEGHAGIVIALVPDASGDSIATVRFYCGPVSCHQDIPVSELAPDGAWTEEKWNTVERERAEALTWLEYGSEEK